MSELPTELKRRFPLDLAEEEQPEPIELAPEGSVLEVIRARRARHAAEQHLDVLVPGHGDLLALRCRPLHAEEMGEIRKRIEALERTKNPMVDYTLAADLLITATREVIARKGLREPWEPIDPTGEPTGISTRLAELLHLDAPSARLCLRGLFEFAPSPEMAITSCVGEYLAWARGESADETDQLLMGES